MHFIFLAVIILGIFFGFSNVFWIFKEHYIISIIIIALIITIIAVLINKNEYINKIDNLSKKINKASKDTIKAKNIGEKIEKELDGSLRDFVTVIYNIYYEGMIKNNARLVEFNHLNNEYMKCVYTIRNALNHLEEDRNEITKKDLKSICEKILNKPDIQNSQDEENLKNYLKNNLAEYLKEILNKLNDTNLAN